MRNKLGFTLIELLITMAILVIIISAAVPAFNTVMRSMQIDSSISSITNALGYARAQAASEQNNVTICPTADSTSCENDQADWAGGWMVFLDDDADGVVDATDDLIYRVWESGTADGSSLEVVDQDDADLDFITFNAEGQLDALTAATMELRVSNCGEGGLRTLNLNVVGRLSSTAGDC